MSPVMNTERDKAAASAGLSPEHLKHVAEAIAAAEQKTSAEIRVVVSRAPVVTHPFFPMLWAGLAALILPWGIQFLGNFSSLSILQVQAIIFMVSAGLFMLPSLSEYVVPRMALKSAVRTAAIETFLAHGMVQTAGRTGVLIFVAAHERMVEVVADEGVHSHLGPSTWAEICASIARHASSGQLGEGLATGVAFAGEQLAVILPPQPGGLNELDDRVIIL